jgi:DNA replication and repair protein RecF
LQEGEAITLARARTVAGLQPIWERLLPELDLPPVALGFHAGWSREESLRDALERHRAADAARGRTLVGPHRFDVRLRADSRPAREVVSRGQQKLLAAAMVLTATQYVAAASGRAPLLLLDDPAAELDAAHARALLAVASRTGGQRLVTALHADGLSETPAQVFHVEQGRVKAL